MLIFISGLIRTQSGGDERHRGYWFWRSYHFTHCLNRNCSNRGKCEPTILSDDFILKHSIEIWLKTLQKTLGNFRRNQINSYFVKTSECQMNLKYIIWPQKSPRPWNQASRQKLLREISTKVGPPMLQLRLDSNFNKLYWTWIKTSLQFYQKIDFLLHKRNQN